MKPGYSWILLVPLLASCAGQRPGSFGTYEAESGQTVNTILQADTTASGGKFLTLCDSSEVTWIVEVPRSGYYQLDIRYRTHGGDQMQYLLKNGEGIATGFEMSDGWNIRSGPFRLDSGTNVLGIRSHRGKMDLDRISVGPASAEFGITPMKNMLYLDSPRDLVFKVDRYDSKIRQVRIDDRPTFFQTEPYPYLEYADWLRIGASELSRLRPGVHALTMDLGEEEIHALIEVEEAPEPADLILVALDTEHGAAMLIRLPSGKHMMIECGTEPVPDSILIPLLRRHHVDTLQTFILTDYPDNHYGGDSGLTALNRFHVQEFIDYRTHPTGYTWNRDGVRFRILNSYPDGDDENTRSLSLSVSYKGFRMVHGGNTDTVSQGKILKRFPGEVPAQVFCASHHFQGSVDPGYIIETNPELVIVQAGEAIYASAAYMVEYKKEAEQVLNRHRTTPVETLLTSETGTVVVRVNDEHEWTYGCYMDQDDLTIPGL